MEDGFYEILTRRKEQEELKILETCSQRTEEKYGLTLSQEEARELIESRNRSLKKYQRVEFGTGILDKLIWTFCDSQYLYQENYREILEKLTEIFYCFKNETQDKLTDDELLQFMKEQFETVCFGDPEYLEGTCLERFARAIRGGYRGYTRTGGQGEYEKFSEEKGWDEKLFLDALRELFW